MNRFWVYLRQYDSVYEPAEGGYYVETSYIEYKEWYTNKLDALDDYFEQLAQLKNEGWKIEEHGRSVYIDLIGKLQTPWAEIDRNGYIGSGATLGICTEEPQDEPYEGYC